MPRGGAQNETGCCSAYYDAQVNYYTEKIKNNSNWKLAGSYVSKYSSWLSYDGSKASINSLDDMIGSYLKRYKTVLSFDAWDLSQFENQEMGKSDINTLHFDDTSLTC